MSKAMVEGVVYKPFDPAVGMFVTQEEYDRRRQQERDGASAEIEAIDKKMPEILAEKNKTKEERAETRAQAKGPGKTIHPTGKANPHRPGSKSFETFETFMKEYKANKNITLDDCVKMGLRINTIRWELDNGFMEYRDAK